MVGQIYRIKGSETRLAVQLTNGPQFRAFLHGMELKLGRIVARVAVGAGAQVIADEWQSLVPVDKGHYRNAIRVVTRSASQGDGEGGRIISGATASIAPGVVGGVKDDEQPFRYAAVLEFGGTLGPKQRHSRIPAHPSARPAFENKVHEAVDKVEATIAAMLP